MSLWRFFKLTWCFTFSTCPIYTILREIVLLLWHSQTLLMIPDGTRTAYPSCSWHIYRVILFTDATWRITFICSTFRSSNCCWPSTFFTSCPNLQYAMLFNSRDTTKNNNSDFSTRQIMLHSDYFSFWLFVNCTYFYIPLRLSFLGALRTQMLTILAVQQFV